MNDKTRYIVSNTNFGFYVVVRIPLENNKVKRMSTGAFPTRELADKVLNQAKQAEDLVQFMREWQEELKKSPYPAEQFEPKIVIFKGKHGDSHYIARTKQEFQKICMAEFKHNNESGYYSHLGKSKKPEVPSFIDTLDTLPIELKKDAEEKVRIYKRDLNWYNQEMELAALRDKVKGGDLEAAAEFITQMREGEYEGFEIVTPQTVE